MTRINTHTDRSLVIEIERDFTASPEQVFASWTVADALARWFAPPGYTTIDAESDPRAGGRWRLEFLSVDGRHRYAEQGVFREVLPYERVVLTLTQVDGAHGNPETLVVVALEDIGSAGSPRTRMRFTQSGYRHPSARDDNEDGWRACFDGLAGVLDTITHRAAAADQEGEEGTEMQELRELFRAWFAASAAKDLDAQMAPIAADVVSYEHNAPQQYRGVAALREVCAEGLEYQDGDFDWDIPDLQIRVVGDLAVTWGLNRMRNTTTDGAVREEWSRGTRIFERRDGRWQMIHQHVSFPIGADGRLFTARE